jgi:DNA-binding response OmpR family regulator
MRILVVEDHDPARTLVERAMREAGHQVESAASLAEARACLARGSFAAIVLDWVLPDGSGTELVREMRQAGDATPVLVLTARGDVEDRVRGLDAGADDYLRKPFAVAELLARTRALLRRGARLESPVITIGQAEFRLEERTVRMNGQDVPVTLREFAILEILLRQRGRPVTRSTLLASVWGAENEGTAQSLEVLVSRLRRKLAGAVPGELIRTHRGVGYSLAWPE